MVAEEGFLCSDVGKIAANDRKSCEEAKGVIQKINPEVSTTIVEEDMLNQPKGCIVMENTIYFNAASDDSPSQGSRQVCKGIQLCFSVAHISFVLHYPSHASSFKFFI